MLINACQAWCQREKKISWFVKQFTYTLDTGYISIIIFIDREAQFKTLSTELKLKVLRYLVW